MQRLSRSTVIVLLSNLATVSSEFTVIEGGTRKIYKTSIFKYYGEQPPDDLAINASALFLNGEKLCNPSAEVAGMIIVSDGVDSRCAYSRIYDQLDRKGALAFMSILGMPVGLSIFWRSHWDVSKFTRRKMPMLSLGVYDIGADVIDHWRSTSMADISSSGIGPEQYRGFYHLFTSTLWTAGFQVLLPMLAFYTAASGLQECRHIFDQPLANGFRQSARHVAIALMLAESTACILLGTLLIFGWGGPFGLPYQVQAAFQSGLSGVSLATTLLLAKYLAEEALGLHTFVRRPIFRYDLSSVAMLSLCVFFFSVDLINMLVVLIHGAEVQTGFNWYGSAVLLAFAQVVVGVYFTRQSRSIFRRLAMFEAAKSRENANMPDMQGSGRQKGAFQAIKHLHFWLSAASLAMFVNSALLLWGIVAGLMIYGVIPDFGIPLSSPAVWYGVMFAFVASRIGISFAQISCFRRSCAPPPLKYLYRQMYRFASRCFGDIAILISWSNPVRVEPLAPQNREPQIFSIDDELLEQARRLEAAWLSEMR